MGYIGNAPYQGVLTGGNIQDGTVETTDLADAAVTTAKLHDQAVTAGKLHNTLDLSGKTLTLPAAAVTAHAPVSSVNGQTGAVTVDTSINSSDVTTALGYTPVNKAGDTMTGQLMLRGGGNFALAEPHNGGFFRSGSFSQTGGGGSGSAASGSWTEYQFGPAIWKTSFSIYIGSGPSDARLYWYFTMPTGSGTWMDYFKFEIYEGNWNYGQMAGYREFYLTSVSNSWAVVSGDSYDRTAMSGVSINFKTNGSTDVRIGGGNTNGANQLRIQMYSVRQIFSHNTLITYTASNPFV